MMHSALGSWASAAGTPRRCGWRFATAFGSIVFTRCTRPFGSRGPFLRLRPTMISMSLLRVVTRQRVQVRRMAGSWCGFVVDVMRPRRAC
jgi:hypothetical protein